MLMEDFIPHPRPYSISWKSKVLALVFDYKIYLELVVNQGSEQLVFTLRHVSIPVYVYNNVLGCEKTHSIMESGLDFLVY